MTDLESIKQSLESLTARLEVFAARADQRFDALEAFAARADKKFDVLEGLAARADQRFETLGAHAVKVDARLANIETNIATKMDLARVRASLEEGQNLILEVARGHTDQLGAIQPALSELGRRVGVLESTVGEDR